MNLPTNLAYVNLDGVLTGDGSGLSNITMAAALPGLTSALVLLTNRGPDHTMTSPGLAETFTETWLWQSFTPTQSGTLYQLGIQLGWNDGGPEAGTGQSPRNA